MRWIKTQTLFSHLNNNYPLILLSELYRTNHSFAKFKLFKAKICEHDNEILKWNELILFALAVHEAIVMLCSNACLAFHYHKWTKIERFKGEQKSSRNVSISFE